MKLFEIKFDSDLLSWFGDSKANLRPGRPMKLYRGISPSIEERHPSAKLGIFATNNRDTASAYAGGTEPNALYMKIRNPYYMEYDEIQSFEDEQQVSDFKEGLKQQGYDGIFLKPMPGSGAHPNAVSEYIAFEPNQIREA